MHDNSIKERTKLRLETETEMQKQGLMDLKLEREGERADKERKLETEKANHEMSLKHEENLQQIRMEKDKLEAELQEMVKRREVRKEHEKDELERLRELQNLGVDLTQYLVSQNKVPDKHFKIETSDGATCVPHLRVD